MQEYSPCALQAAVVLQTKLSIPLIQWWVLARQLDPSFIAEMTEDRWGLYYVTHAHKHAGSQAQMHTWRARARQIMCAETRWTAGPLIWQCRGIQMQDRSKLIGSSETPGRQSAWCISHKNTALNTKPDRIHQLHVNRTRSGLLLSCT